MATLAIINPRKRRSRKHRSAAQRRATAKLVAFMRARRGGHKRHAARVNPRRSRRRSRIMHHARRVIHRFRRRARRNPLRLPSMGGLFRGNAGRMIGCGVAGGAGAVSADLGMGLLQKFLPANLAAPIALRYNTTDGSVNWLYYAAKTGVGLTLGLAGRKLPLVGRYAYDMGTGVFTVMSYEILRGMLGTALPLGAYFNPAVTGAPVPGVGGMGKHLALSGGRTTYPAVSSLHGLGAYAPRVRSTGAGAGARAANVLSMVGPSNVPIGQRRA